MGLSPSLHCSPPPYANTPISAFTPFLQHTASSWVNASFSPNTVLCALDNLFHKTSHLLPCPPPTTRLPNTGRYSTTPASVERHSFAKLPTSRFWFATYDSFIECQAHSVPAVFSIASRLNSAESVPKSVPKSVPMLPIRRWCRNGRRLSSRT